MKPLRLMAMIMLVLWGSVGQAPAQQPEERLSNPISEERARGLSAQLRCLVCQNQSIDDSDAPFARDMRRMIRQQITEGQTDDEIITFLRQRYGDYVLLNPPFSNTTALLWIAPFAFLVIGVAGIALARRGRNQNTSDSKQS